MEHDRKEGVTLPDAGDEKFVENADKQNLHDGMSDHDRKVMTRKILLKLDFR